MVKNVLIILNNLQQMQLKRLRKESLKTAEATGDLIGNKITNRITKFSKNSRQNYLEAVTNEHDKEIPKEKYVSLGER